MCVSIYDALLTRDATKITTLSSMQFTLGHICVTLDSIEPFFNSLNHITLVFFVVVVLKVHFQDVL